jgi:hypothetical protein
MKGDIMRRSMVMRGNIMRRSMVMKGDGMKGDTTTATATTAVPGWRPAVRAWSHKALAPPAS